MQSGHVAQTVPKHFTKEWSIFCDKEPDKMENIGTLNNLILKDLEWKHI